MFSKSFATVITSLTCLSSCVLFAANLVAAEIEIFKEPPSPQRLADIVFAPRYRSASVAEEDGANRFGMMINFEHDSTKVLPESLPLLDSVGKMLDLAAVREEVLVIEGHTDASGTERYNENLSVRRANAIKYYLIESYNIDPGRLVTIGHGETALHDSVTPTNPINRRVEFRSMDTIVVR